MREKKAKPKAVTPRIAEMIRATGMKVQQDEFDSVSELEDVLSVDMKGRGRLSGRRAISESYNAPGFKDDGRGNFVEPISSSQMVEGDAEDEETEDNRLLKRFDCTHGCQAKGTVQPINSTGVDWECSECGFKYKLS